MMISFENNSKDANDHANTTYNPVHLLSPFIFITILVAALSTPLYLSAGSVSFKGMVLVLFLLYYICKS